MSETQANPQASNDKLSLTIAGVATGHSMHVVNVTDDDEQFGGEDTGSVFSIPDEFLESQPEDQITMLLELTRTMR